MTATTGDALSQVLWKWPVGVFSAANRRREPGAPAAMQVSVHSPEDSFRRALHASHDVASGNAPPFRIIPFPPLLAEFSSCPRMTLRASNSKY